MNKKCVEYMTLSLKLFEDHVEIEVSEKELARSLIKLMGCDPEYILKIFQGAAMELDAYITSSDCVEE